MASDDDRARLREYRYLQDSADTKVHSIASGQRLPTIAELALGYPLLGKDLPADARAWLSKAMGPGVGGRLPRSVERAILAVLHDPTHYTLTRLRRSTLRLHPTWSVPYKSRIVEIRRRSDIYLAHLDDTEAAARCAVDIFVTLTYLQGDITPEGRMAAGSLVGMLLLAARGRCRHYDYDGHVDRLRDELVGMARVVPIESEPTEAGKAGPLAALAADADDDLFDYERNGIVRSASPVVALPAPPTLVILQSVSHLAGSAKDGAKISGASNARGEFAPLAGVDLPLVHEADVASVAATVRAEWPWAGAVVDAMLADLVGRAWHRFRPTLLVGPPGAGKTRLARRIGELLGLDVTVFPCAGVHDGAFGGTSRQWSTGRACVPLQAIRRSMVANPVIVLDEIEKTGTRRENGSLQDCLVPLLEAESAARYHDQYVECAVDLSAVSYVATANSLDGIPAPLLDRLRVLRVPEPEAEHLGDIARRIVDELRRERGTDAAWTPDLAGDELDLIASHWKGGSLRKVRRMVEAVLSARDTLAERH